MADKSKDDGHKDMVEEAKEEMDEAKNPVKRKRGGNIKGMMAKGRPDKRARGGATSDLNPTTAAGKVSSPDYLSATGTPNGAMSKGGDTRGKNG
jgi:hypothetical protein